MFIAGSQKLLDLPSPKDYMKFSVAGSSLGFCSLGIRTARHPERRSPPPGEHAGDVQHGLGFARGCCKLEADKRRGPN